MKVMEAFADVMEVFTEVTSTEAFMEAFMEVMEAFVEVMEAFTEVTSTEAFDVKLPWKIWKI